jgi:SAM-dependent methyltransferase
MATDINLRTYSDPAVVAEYARREKLQPCEEVLFQRWIRPGATVLDLGVGGGRTAGPLSKIASCYIGLDYSQGMVEACRARYPHLEFRHGDATDLSRFDDRHFDAVVFSANGIDCIRTDEGRAECLREVARVLKLGGVFIVSSHNAQAIGVWPQLKTAHGLQIPWRILYSLYASARLAARHLSHAAFWKGSGYLFDPEFGGFAIYVSTPRTFAPQVQSVGLKVVDLVGLRYPEVQALWLTPWYYYACRKTLQA